jgi:hypothetical protein
VVWRRYAALCPRPGAQARPAPPGPDGAFRAKITLRDVARRTAAVLPNYR